MTGSSVSRLSLELSDASGIPFYRQIVDQLAELIRSGRLGPGTRLPSVRDLAAQTMVSLITILGMHLAWQVSPSTAVLTGLFCSIDP